MICPGCNSPVSPDAVFCDNCGASLSAPPASVPAVNSTLPSVPCPVCGVPVALGEEFCDNCGHALTPGPALAAGTPGGEGDDLPTPPIRGAESVVCGACGTSNLAIYSFCDGCGVPLVAQHYPAAPRSEAAAAVESSPPPQQTDVVGPTATIALADGSHVFDLSTMQQALIGRMDPISGTVPEVDLLRHGGLEGGVGRQHARLTLEGGQWQIEDLNSVNATLVNQQRLQPGTPHALNDGDELQVGRVRLRFRIVQD